MSRELRTNVQQLVPLSGGKVAVTVLVHAADVEQLQPGNRVALVVPEPIKEKP